MRGSVFGAGRNVLPIGQEMNGDEIDIGADFPVAQPEFPDVGIGHGNITRGLTERMISRRSDTIISPRSSTSLPTMIAVTVPG